MPVSLLLQALSSLYCWLFLFLLPQLLPPSLSLLWPLPQPISLSYCCSFSFCHHFTLFSFFCCCRCRYCCCHAPCCPSLLCGLLHISINTAIIALLVVAFCWSLLVTTAVTVGCVECCIFWSPLLSLLLCWLLHFYGHRCHHCLVTCCILSTGLQFLPPLSIFLHILVAVAAAAIVLIFTFCWLSPMLPLLPYWLLHIVVCGLPSPPSLFCLLLHFAGHRLSITGRRRRHCCCFDDCWDFNASATSLQASLRALDQQSLFGAWMQRLFNSTRTRYINVPRSYSSYADCDNQFCVLCTRYPWKAWKYTKKTTFKHRSITCGNDHQLVLYTTV